MAQDGEFVQGSCASSSTGSVAVGLEAGTVEFDFGEDVPPHLIKAVPVVSKHVHPVVDLLPVPADGSCGFGGG